MKRYITFFVLCLLVVATATAQQDAQYTQFMFNKLVYNPGYGGSQNAACITAIVRNQWMGIEGAPQTQALSFNMPVSNQRVGVGGNIFRNTIGETENITVDASYAYRIPMGNGMLGLGAQASVRLFRVNFNRLTSTQPRGSDPAIPTGTQSKYLPNFGLGAYYTGETFYLGISMPRLLQNNIDFADDQTIISRESRHFYAMGGLLFPINENLKLQPQVLLKLVTGAPFDADANLNLVILDRFTVGVSYRIGGSLVSGVGESVDMLVAAQVSENILLGVSYDITISGLQDYNTGSIEAAIRYCIGSGNSIEDYSNPRFF
ncbi:MAG: type IX secretion system membrane protein PorP/SprF [Bacteroidota bacterium]